MERIAETINKIYQKYLPIVKKVGISLDIDFPDTTLTIRERESVERELDKTVRNAVSRAQGGRISIAVHRNAIIVSDNGTVLSATACEVLSTGRVQVTSKVGFGTKVVIKLQD